MWQKPTYHGWGKILKLKKSFDLSSPEQKCSKKSQCFNQTMTKLIALHYFLPAKKAMTILCVPHIWSRASHAVCLAMLCPQCHYLLLNPPAGYLLVLPLSLSLSIVHVLNSRHSVSLCLQWWFPRAPRWHRVVCHRGSIGVEWERRINRIKHKAFVVIARTISLMPFFVTQARG